MSQFLLLFFIAILYFIFAKKYFKKLSQPQRNFTPNASEKIKTNPVPCGGMLFFITFITFGMMERLPTPQILLISGFFAIGLIDDAGKVLKKSHISFLKGKWRLLLQILISIMFALFFVKNQYQLNIYKYSFSLPIFCSIPLLVFIISGTANAVNLTDGQDALAGKTTLMVLFFLATVGFSNLPLITVLLAFLLFNSKPATVYMGDSGSLTLGAIIATQFIQAKIEWLLPLVGIVFVAEALSVIVQVSYFKITKGRRIFKMSPIHHHFELSGYSEEKISNFALIITIVASLCALIILQNVA